ncbi:CARDB domain-containing protein [Haloterrigena alkaliphila]|uniref:CARDB domain-containing protein n=1 Tax=Haloterrigena alkaliphila TaxID=2816475 RepID=A0A8A2VE99_9EURY|nr:CARDB domain-containing protein [Haloterrigena alkaliphila]QSX00380.1 hypothetical protein J0X25_05275 [Haloterrigena alkaliphila]
MSSLSWPLIVGLVVLSIGLAIPTGAVVLSASDPVEADTHVELASSTSANGQYASIKGDQLQLDLKALNDRAVTTADDVFTITVTDDAVQRVWIENDVTGLEFYESDDPSARITESNPLESSAGETIDIGVVVDTHVDHADTETFTIHVAYEDGNDFEPPTPKGVSLESLSVTPTTVETGGSVTVNATYRNDGPETKELTSDLTIDGTVVDTEPIELEPGETKSVVFGREMQWPGRYDVSVDGTASERVTVTGPPIDVLEASVTDTALTAGETGTIEATVSNPTGTAVTRTLELAVDGVVVDTRTVRLEPNGTTTVAFEHTFGEAGTYEVSVSGVEAGTVTVSEPGPYLLQDRELSAATTAALAPPLATGLLFLGAAANRRWSFLPSR